ncbi:MAG: acyl-CoA synthetase [Myxococcota bacterium]|jgi:fatty-acyl-CoA synthase|nr:acyl-CoA synthetase [Myxococcota bacterium]
MYPGHWARIHPDKAAVVNTATGEERTYRELDERSNRLAQLLHAQGLRRGDHVALLMENHVAYFDVAWAALRSGLYLTAVNRYLTADEAGYIVDDCEARVVVSSRAMAEVAEGLPGLAPRCERWLAQDGGVEGYEDLDKALAASSPEPLAEEPAGAYMLYSSGTTGRPKGITRPLADKGVAENGAVNSGLQQKLWGFGEDTVYLSPAPLYHSAPLGFCTAAQICGGTVVMMPKFDPRASLQAIEDHRVTHSQWVPTMFSRMLKLDPGELAGFDLSSHRCAIHAAAPCPRPVKQQMLDWWGDIIYEYYGGTELNGLTHIEPQDWRERPGTVGKSILGVLHVCDEEGTELPAGEPGIVYFERPELTFRYHNDDDKTKSVQHPHHPTWTALGDVGYLDEDGFLFLTDRATFMIISGGVNIYPQEIEDVLIMHPKVADVAVVGVPHEEMGEEVKAVVQPAEGVAPDEALEREILAYARDHISHYKCPRSVDFEAELPRLPTGKLYKRLLKDRYWGKHDSGIV